MSDQITAAEVQPCEGESCSFMNAPRALEAAEAALCRAVQLDLEACEIAVFAASTNYRV